MGSRVQVLRVFGQIFFQVLDVATMSLLLIAMDCRYFSVPDDQRGYNVVRALHVTAVKRCARLPLASPVAIPLWHVAPLPGC